MPLSSWLETVGLSVRSNPVAPVHGPALAMFSNLSSTAFKRHLQSLHETGDRRNPDILAGALLSDEDREACLRIGGPELAALRVEPYYHYLTARTKVYDQVLLDAIVHGIRRVVIVGSGFDTRFHRFGSVLAAHDVDLAECDQPAAIAAKRELATSLPYADRVHYFGIDLNEASSWTELWGWICAGDRPALILAEGVSPYVESAAYEEFLAEVAARLPVGSRLAYDFKLSGVADGFGKNASVTSPFRLNLDTVSISGRHRQMGFKDVAVTTSRELMLEYVPSWTEQVSPLFTEDALIRAVR